jgi:DNA-binding NtrC family response regulator
VPALAAHFAQAACRRNHWRPRGVSAAGVEVLRRQPWKGNVRELRNVVERALILSPADPLDEADISAALGTGPPRDSGLVLPGDGPLRDLVDAFEREAIRERLRRHGGNVTAAARSLDLERSHLYKKCQKLGLDIREEP